MHVHIYTFMCMHVYMYARVYTHVHETQESNKEFITVSPQLGEICSLLHQLTFIPLLNSTYSSFWGLSLPPKGLVLGRR